MNELHTEPIATTVSAALPVSSQQQVSSGHFPELARLPQDQRLSNVIDSKETKTENAQSGTIEESSEQIEATQIETTKKTFKGTPKFNEWCRLFLDKSNEETFGNKTQSALQAYNLDPKSQYHVGGQIGYENFKKLETFASSYADSKGYTVGKLLDHAYLKFLKSDSPEWWDRLMDYFGYRSMKPQVMVQNNTQTNTQINVVPEGEQKTFNDQFRDFIKAS